MISHIFKIISYFTLASLIVAFPVFAQQNGSERMQSVPHIDELIIVLKSHARGPKDSIMSNIQAKKLSDFSRMDLKPSRVSDEERQIVKLPRKLTPAEAEALANYLKLNEDVEDVLPNYRIFLQAVPNDTRYALDQWNLQSTTGGANLPLAWDVTKGSSNVIVGIIDSGTLPHADLTGRILSGYDFVSNIATANDGTGRDSIPADPGDWITAVESASGTFVGCPITNSTWHGTNVAGIIGAASNNGAGVAGINWVSKILSVRVTGKCGGTVSDLIDALKWTAGLPIIGVPNNTNIAKVINTSLGG